MESVNSQERNSETLTSSVSRHTLQGQEYRPKRRLAKCSQSLKFVLARPTKERRELVKNPISSYNGSVETMGTAGHLGWIESPEVDVNKSISLVLEKGERETSLGDKRLSPSIPSICSNNSLPFMSELEGETKLAVPAQPSLDCERDMSWSAKPKQTTVAEGEKRYDTEEDYALSREDEGTIANSEGLSGVRDESKSLKAVSIASMEICCLQPRQNIQLKPQCEALYSNLSSGCEALPGHLMVKSIPSQPTRDASQKCSMTVTSISVLKDYCLGFKTLTDNTKNQESRNLFDDVQIQESLSWLEKSTIEEEKTRSNSGEGSSMPQLDDTKGKANAGAKDNSIASQEMEEPPREEIKPSTRSVFCTVELPDKYLGMELENVKETLMTPPRPLHPEQHVENATTSTSEEADTPLSKQQMSGTYSPFPTQKETFPDGSIAGETVCSIAEENEDDSSVENTVREDPSREKKDIEKVQVKRSARKKVNHYRKRMLFSPRKRSAAPRVLYSMKMPQLEEDFNMVQCSELPLVIGENREDGVGTLRTVLVDRKESKSSDADSRQIYSPTKSSTTASRDKAQNYCKVKSPSAPRSVKLQRFLALRQSLGWFPEMPSSQEVLPHDKPLESMKPGRRSRTKKCTYPLYPVHTIIRKLSRTKYWKKSLLDIIRRRKEDITFHKPETVQKVRGKDCRKTRLKVSEHSNLKADSKGTNSHSYVKYNDKTLDLRASAEQHVCLTNEVCILSPGAEIQRSFPRSSSRCKEKQDLSHSKRWLRHIRTMNNYSSGSASKARTCYSKKGSSPKYMSSDSLKEQEQEGSDRLRKTDASCRDANENREDESFIINLRQKLKLMRGCFSFLSVASDESQRKIASLLSVEIKKMESILSDSKGSAKDTTENIQKMGSMSKSNGFEKYLLEANDSVSMTGLMEESDTQQSEREVQAPLLSEQEVQLEEVEVTLSIAKKETESRRSPVLRKDKTADTNTRGRMRTVADCTEKACISSALKSAVTVTTSSPKIYRKGKKLIGRRKKSYGRGQRADSTSDGATPVQRPASDCESSETEGESPVDIGMEVNKNVQKIVGSTCFGVESSGGANMISVSESAVTSTPTRLKRNFKKRRTLIGRRRKSLRRGQNEKSYVSAAPKHEKANSLDPVQMKANGLETSGIKGGSTVDVGVSESENFQDALDPSCFNFRLGRGTATTECPIDFTNFLDEVIGFESENTTPFGLPEIEEAAFSDLAKEGQTNANLFENEGGSVDGTLEDEREGSDMGEKGHLPESCLEDFALTCDLRAQLMRDLDLSSSFSPARSEKEYSYFDHELGKGHTKEFQISSLALDSIDNQSCDYTKNFDVDIECETLAGEGNNEKESVGSQDENLTDLTEVENVVKKLVESEPCTGLVTSTNAKEIHQEATTSQNAENKLQNSTQNSPVIPDQEDKIDRRESEKLDVRRKEGVEENGNEVQDDEQQEGERPICKDQDCLVGNKEKDNLASFLRENSNAKQDSNPASDSDCEDVLSIYAQDVADLDSDLENEEAGWKENMDESEILDENPDSALHSWSEHREINSPTGDARSVTKYPANKLSLISRTAINESANNLVIVFSDSEKEREGEEEFNDEDSRWFLGRRRSEMERKPKNDDKPGEGEAIAKARGCMRAGESLEREASCAQSASSACGKRTLEEGNSGREKTQKCAKQSSELEDGVSSDFEMGQKTADDLVIVSATQASVVDVSTIDRGNQMPVVARAEREGNERDISMQIHLPVKPVGYCHRAVDRGWCDRSICRFRHEMSKELEAYYSQLMLHYVSQGRAHLGWRVLGFNTVTAVNNPYLRINILMPLARHLVQGTFRDVKVPSHVTPLLDISKLRALCEAGKGFEAYKLLNTCHTSFPPYMLQLLLREFVRYCECWPVRDAVTPWEKVQSWKWNEGQGTIKDLLNISWLDFHLRQRNGAMVCRAYDYLCQSIKIPSAFFTHITCSVIKFFNEMGDREKSFNVLKEVRRLNAKDPKIFTLLVPPDQETAKHHTTEVLELVQFVCEEKVQLSVPTFTLLINAIRAIDQLVLTIDLIICAVKVCQYDPEVSLLEILILDSIRKFPQLLWPVSNLVCVLPAKSLVLLRPTLRHALDMLHFAPPPAQQVEENIVCYCHSKGVFLYEEPVGQFAQRGREGGAKASPNNRLRAVGKETLGSQGHQEVLCKDGNVTIPSQPSRFRVGNCEQERMGPGLKESKRGPSLPSLVMKEQVRAPSPVQLQNTLQKQPTSLRLGNKIYRNTGHQSQKSSSIPDVPRPILPRSPQIQNIPGFLKNNSLPPGIKINIIGWPNVETKHIMNNANQVIQKLKSKHTDNVTVSKLSTQNGIPQKAEGSSAITGNCSQVQSHSVEMDEAGSAGELKISKCIPSNHRIASSRSKMDHLRFMMPKSRKGLPPVETIAKGSEKSISEQVQISSYIMESKSTMFGDFEIDLQGAPEQK
ncbi:uncharacterized protein LOC125027644 isoform X2 [Penaeus chinensis]|uniref:uncharacterized protein LOC125027644 isoform X2 n=1 Tax=Penaeus chinensis TaxID=139456 RepID=UPI001FB600C2|nr:uncharacterized protein LOC125027644 isoform X2 [Penaeus chinensis]